MRRIVALVLPWVLAIGAEATAQDWAKKMFEINSHDFGIVARLQTRVFVRLHQHLQRRCPHLRRAFLVWLHDATRDQGPDQDARAVRNHGRLQHPLVPGAKSATVTVTIDEPFYAEVQLKVNGYIRSDVVFNPGAVEFGSVETGKAHRKR